MKHSRCRNVCIYARSLSRNGFLNNKRRDFVVINFTDALMYRVSGLEVYKNTCFLVPESFMKFIFSTVYKVTQKDFYALPYTSMWAPFVVRQISKRYSSSCHVFISK